MLKTALICVVCLDNHFHMQELTDYLPGSYKTEEIFHIGIRRALKIRAGFYTREGWRCNLVCNLITQLLRGKLGVSNFMCNLITQLLR
jgi:hypothetical protein